MHIVTIDIYNKLSAKTFSIFKVKYVTDGYSQFAFFIALTIPINPFTD